MHDREQSPSRIRTALHPIVIAGATLGLLLALAPPALAFNTLGVQWDGGLLPSITYKFHSVQWANNDAFYDAQRYWDEDISGLYHTPTSSSDPNIDVYDYWSDGDYLAMIDGWHYSWSSAWANDEVALIFNDRTLAGASDTKRLDVASHELAHALGLDHVSHRCGSDGTIMSSYYAGGCSGVPPHPDDLQGFNYLY